MKYKFDNAIFAKWFNMNGMKRNNLIVKLGQRDPNKVGRWLAGQTIGTEDLLALCNVYDLELTDFLVKIEEQPESRRIHTELPEEIKERRKKEVDGKQLAEIATQSLKADDITLTRIALKYEQQISEIERKHNKEIQELMTRNRHAGEDRSKMVSELQRTIGTLTDTIAQLQENSRQQQATIQQQQATIESQQATIATMDALVRKQKKIPSQTAYPQVYGSASTMVNDGGAAIHTATPPID